MATLIPFDEAPTSDLLVDAVYGGSDERQQDALHRLLKVGVQGGFRPLGRAPNYRLVVLTTSGTEPEWPDTFDPTTGLLVYFGDNRSPGRELHRPIGNQILRSVFDLTHSPTPRREEVPPFFVFRKRTLQDPPGTTNRDLVFVGMAAPGAANLGEADDLTASWRTKRGLRFQNYRAIFTILDAHPIRREWLDSVIAGRPDISLAPTAWQEWVRTGRHRALAAPEHPRFRTEEEQWPATATGIDIIRCIRSHFMPDATVKADATQFEDCAAQLWRMAAGARVNYEVTRPVVDRGRDAIGELLLGPGADLVPLDFALEAKLYDYEAGVRVRTGDTKRLISRLRHRQFGVLVTTSVVHRQAYDEVREDQHPLVIMSARDIVDTLAAQGLADVKSVQDWLTAEFPTRNIAQDGSSKPQRTT